MDILADDNVTFDGDATALRDHCLHRQPGKELEKGMLFQQLAEYCPL